MQKTLKDKAFTQRHDKIQRHHCRQNALRNKPYLWLFFPFIFFFCPSSEVYAIPGAQFGILPEGTFDTQRQISNSVNAINNLSSLDFVPQPSITPSRSTLPSVPEPSITPSPVSSKNEPNIFIADTDSRQRILDTGTIRLSSMPLIS